MKVLIDGKIVECDNAKIIYEDVDGDKTDLHVTFKEKSIMVDAFTPDVIGAVWIDYNTPYEFLGVLYDRG